MHLEGALGVREALAFQPCSRRPLEPSVLILQSMPTSVVSSQGFQKPHGCKCLDRLSLGSFPLGIFGLSSFFDLRVSDSFLIRSALLAFLC